MFSGGLPFPFPLPASACFWLRTDLFFFFTCHRSALKRLAFSLHTRKLTLKGVFRVLPVLSLFSHVSISLALPLLLLFSLPGHLFASFFFLCVLFLFRCLCSLIFSTFILLFFFLLLMCLCLRVFIPMYFFFSLLSAAVSLIVSAFLKFCLHSLSASSFSLPFSRFLHSRRILLVYRGCLARFP